MTPKEKAKELVDKFKDFIAFDYRGDEEPIFECQKQCAIICVNELITQNGELYFIGLDDVYYKKKNAYLFDVKHEIEKL